MVRYGNAITPEQTSVPKKVFAVMGALDGLSGVMQIFASTYLGGALIILLSQVRSSHRRRHHHQSMCLFCHKRARSFPTCFSCSSSLSLNR